jgi:hypothetical protein
MRRIKEVLRLKEGLGLSDTAVSRSVRIARSTVKEYLDRATAAGLSWEIAAELSEEELDRRLFAAADTRHPDRPLPDWEAVEKELRGRGVTLRLLWLEYLSRHKATATPSSARISTPGSDAPGRRRCASSIAPARRSKSIGPG